MNNFNYFGRSLPNSNSRDFWKIKSVTYSPKETKLVNYTSESHYRTAEQRDNVVNVTLGQIYLNSKDTGIKLTKLQQIKMTLK